MLKSIENELLKTKSCLEAQKQSEIASQKAKAEIELIAPKVAELEKEKQQALKLARDSYDKSAQDISANYEKQKADYVAQVNAAVEAKVSVSFQHALDGVDRLLSEQ